MKTRAQRRPRRRRPCASARSCPTRSRSSAGGPPAPPPAPPPRGGGGAAPVRVGAVVPDALALIGGTPLVRLARISPEGGGVVYAKLESMNPGGSVKDRAALGMVLDAEREGKLGEGSTIIEATSGNTGIS